MRHIAKITRRIHDLKLHLPKFKRFNRLIYLTSALLVAFSVTVPIIDHRMEAKRYTLTPNAESLLGSQSPTLASKFSFDKDAKKYQFNKEGAAKAAQAAESSQQVGVGDGSKLYAADLYQDSSKGVTIYDTVNKLSFGLTPLFKTLDGKQQQNHIVYPLSTAPQLVYSAKANGLKEDIILTRPAGDKAEFSYKLNLNSDLEARILDSGAVGVYSADPTLYGNITFGSDADREKVELARKNAKKDNLVFFIPAPIIKQTGLPTGQAGKGTGNPTAKFTLKDNLLTVTASGLKTASYPLSIDPSVVVTSSTDFSGGDNEGGIQVDSGGAQIRRESLSGGTLAAWATTTALPATSRYEQHQMVAYNGFLYLTGGNSDGFGTNAVYYASLNASTGAVGTWTSTSTMIGSGRRSHASVAYSGYLYVFGGSDATGPAYSDVLYAKIRGDGSLAAWQNTTALPTVLVEETAVAYNGYVYIAGGIDDAGETAKVRFAPIKGDGSLGSWTLSSNILPAVRRQHVSAAYNNTIYVIAGAASGSFQRNIFYAHINSDGTLSAWQTSNTVTNYRTAAAAAVHNGYIYLSGGYGFGGPNGTTTLNSVEVIALNSDGSAADTTTLQTNTSAFTRDRNLHASAYYNGYVYISGGYSNDGGGGVTYGKDVQYAKVNGAGETSEFTSLGDFDTLGRVYTSSIAYNGFLYVTGGADLSETTFTNVVRMAAINADGTIGSWSSLNAFTTARYMHTTVIGHGYLYIIGGYGGCGLLGATDYCNDVQYAQINSNNGTLGSWTTSAQTLPVARRGHASVFYNGYVYVIGGRDSSGIRLTVYYEKLDPTPSLNGAWQTNGNSLSRVQELHSAAVSNGYVYVTGGRNGATIYREVHRSAINNTNGTLGAWTLTDPGNVGNWGSQKYGHYSWTHNGYLYEAGGCSNGGTCTNGTDDVQFLKLNNDGSVGNWTVSTPFAMAGPRLGQSGAIYNGQVYIMGGKGSNTFKDVWTARINNGGSGAINSWTTGTSMNTARRQHGGVAYGSRIYVFGGCTNTACTTTTNSIEYATVNADASLSSWTTDTKTLTANRTQMAPQVIGDYVYLLGGRDSSNNPLSIVEYAKFNSDSSLSSNTCGTSTTWCTTTSLPGICSLHDSAAYNGRIYLMGGNCAIGGTFTQKRVRFATPASDGTIASWTETTDLPYDAYWAPAAVAYGGYLYAIGGCEENSCTTRHADVSYALINSNGTIGSWNTTSSISGPRRSAEAIARNGYMYIMGGDGGSDVQKTPILASGAVGTWQNTTRFAGTLNYIAVVSGQYAYVSGGEDGTNVFATTRYMSPQSISRSGRYRYGFDLAGDATPTKMLVNGSLQAPSSLIKLDYNTVRNDGVLGTPTAVNNLALASLLSLTGSFGRLFNMSLTIDDSQSATFPDSSSTTLTDLELFFHAASTHRLRGGKTFTSETQRSLDAQP